MSKAAPETAPIDEQKILQRAIKNGIIEVNGDGMLTAKIKDEIAFVLVWSRLSGEEVWNEYWSVKVVHTDEQLGLSLLRSPNFRQNIEGTVFHVSKLKNHILKAVA